jgi:hypothetical protein
VKISSKSETYTVKISKLTNLHNEFFQNFRAYTAANFFVDKLPERTANGQPFRFLNRFVKSFFGHNTVINDVAVLGGQRPSHVCVSRL